MSIVTVGSVWSSPTLLMQVLVWSTYLGCSISDPWFELNRELYTSYREVMRGLEPFVQFAGL